MSPCRIKLKICPTVFAILCRLPRGRLQADAAHGALGGDADPRQARPDQHPHLRTAGKADGGADNGNRVTSTRALVPQHTMWNFDVKSKPPLATERELDWEESRLTFSLSSINQI